MLQSIGTTILTVLALLLLVALSAGFGVLCFLVGVAFVRGFPAFVREQPRVQKLTTALIFGPFAAIFAFVGFGLAVLCFLLLPLLLFNWLAPPQVISQAQSWVNAPSTTMVISRVATIGLGLTFVSFALGISLACFLGIPQMVPTLHAFFDFIAELFALGLGILFLNIAVALCHWILTGTS
jgi:hypothetical protein